MVVENARQSVARGTDTHRGLPGGVALLASRALDLNPSNQRCFWLFVVLLALIGAVSFVPANDHGRLVLNGVTMFLLIATVAAVGRTTLSFVIALLLAVPAVWFQYLGLWHDSDSDLAGSWMFSAALYFITTAYLLRYVFQPKIMTQDKLSALRLRIS